MEEINVLCLIEPLLPSLGRSLDASVLTIDGLRDVDAAQLFDPVVEDAVPKDQIPGLGEGPDGARMVGPDGLALGPRRAM